jgi:hypothetical protein
VQRLGIRLELFNVTPPFFCRMRVRVSASEGTPFSGWQFTFFGWRNKCGSFDAVTTVRMDGTVAFSIYSSSVGTGECNPNLGCRIVARDSFCADSGPHAHALMRRWREVPDGGAGCPKNVHPKTYFFVDLGIGVNLTPKTPAIERCR